MDADPVPLTERISPPLATTSSPRDLEPDSAELEKLRQWHQARIERKLRDEYETALLRLDELVKDNLQTPLRIASVRVAGKERTRPEILKWLTDPYITTANSESSTLNDVLRATKRVTDKMLETDVYKAVLPRLEASHSPYAQPGDVDLVLYTAPRGAYFLKTSTEMGNQDGSVSLQGQIRNSLGLAETLDVTLSSGLRTRLSGNVTYSSALRAMRSRGEFSLFGLEKDLTNFASCIEGVRGVRATLRSFGKHTSSEINGEAVLRHIHGLTENASLSIREIAGPSTKFSLSHSWTFDSRDEKSIPSKGGYLRTYNELAALNTESGFYKTQGSFQWVHSFVPGLHLSLSGRAGYIHPFGSIGNAPFNDRFQMGGPLDVRMFKQNGLGPREGKGGGGGGDSLGGDLFWATGLSVVSDLPARPDWPVKVQAFVNAGRLDLLNRTGGARVGAGQGQGQGQKERTLVDNVRDSLSRPCVSVGVGLLYRFDPVRVEVNFGVPVVANKNDGLRRGFQVGIGLDFL